MIDKKLELLSKVRKVEAPVFLKTRINQKIENLRSNDFSPQWSWVMGISLALIIAVNVIVIIKFQSHAKEQLNLAEMLNLFPQNDLYR